MKHTRRNLTIRREAIETLRESTELLQQALELMEADKGEEMEHVREVARAKRLQSAMLMSVAVKLDKQESQRS